MKTYLVMLGACLAGCSHNVPPPESPVVETIPLSTTIQVESEEPRQEVPCGQELSVSVSKLDVNLPEGGTLEIAGVKGDTKQYHLLLEGLTFVHRNYCLH
jgi:hypothetical protein